MKNRLSYQQRAEYCSNPTAKKLLQLMALKESNLALSLDLTQPEQFLALADAVGPQICVLKTHIDIVEDFSPSITAELTCLAQKHNFLIFEDRKFADIGHTVQLQYGGGIYHIAEWADIVNAHPLPGPGIIDGLKAVGLEKGRGLLLLAQMSAQQNLLNKHYTQSCVAMAEQHPDFVIGFIAMEQLSEDPRMIHFTPGIHQASAGDNMGQQYVTPTRAIFEHGTDIIIVGRGIYAADDAIAAAQAYRTTGWEAYQQRLALP